VKSQAGEKDFGLLDSSNKIDVNDDTDTNKKQQDEMF